MPVAIVLDQGVPRDAAGMLRDCGYECIHVGEVGMAAASDEEILGFAFAKSASSLQSMRTFMRFSPSLARWDRR